MARPAATIDPDQLHLHVKALSSLTLGISKHANAVVEGESTPREQPVTPDGAHPNMTVRVSSRCFSISLAHAMLQLLTPSLFAFLYSHMCHCCDSHLFACS
jgi:hypothetical protein